MKSKSSNEDSLSIVGHKISVSVVVPVYNSQMYIAKSLSSLLEQTLDDIEIIIINDGSTDDSLSVIERVIEECPQHNKTIRIINRGNKGVSYTRAEGTSLASGEFIIHIDSDDWIEPTMLEDMYLKIVSDDADVLICNYYMVMDDKEESVKQKADINKYNCITNILLGNMQGFTWNKLIRRKLIIENEITFNVELNYLEDVVFIIQVLKIANKISFIDKSLYHYRRDNPNSLTSKIDEVKINNVVNAINFIEFFLLENIAEISFAKPLNKFKLTQKVWFLSQSKMSSNNISWNMFQKDKLPIIDSDIRFYYKLILVLHNIGYHYLAKKILYIIGYIQVKIKGR